jgi:hypothetical protein
MIETSGTSLKASFFLLNLWLDRRAFLSTFPIPINPMKYDWPLFVYIFGGQKCISHSFANVAHFFILRDVWIQTQRAAVASRCVTNLATHFSVLPPDLYYIWYPKIMYCSMLRVWKASWLLLRSARVNWLILACFHVLLLTSWAISFNFILPDHANARQTTYFGRSIF